MFEHPGAPPPPSWGAVLAQVKPGRAEEGARVMSQFMGVYRSGSFFFLHITCSKPQRLSVEANGYRHYRRFPCTCMHSRAVFRQWWLGSLPVLLPARCGPVSLWNSSASHCPHFPVQRSCMPLVPIADTGLVIQELHTHTHTHTLLEATDQQPRTPSALQLICLSQILNYDRGNVILYKTLH